MKEFIRKNLNDIYVVQNVMKVFINLFRGWFVGVNCFLSNFDVVSKVCEIEKSDLN